MGFELDLIHWLQSFSGPFLDTMFRLITMFGEEIVLVVILGYVYWSHDKLIGERLAFTIFVSLTLNSVIKLVISRPRPFVVDDTIVNLKPDTSSGYSFPSGHTQTATTSFFGLYAFLKKKWLLIVAIIVTTLVAVSRMYLGVHYLTDVLVGAILGIGIAFLMAKYYPKVKNPDRIYRWILIGVLIGLVALFILNYVQNISGGVLDAAAYYFDTESIAKMLGTISGFIVAIGYEKKHVQFQNHKILYKNLIRFALGIAVIMAVRLGLKALFTWIIDPESLVQGEGFKAIMAGLFDYLRYFAMLFIGIGLYPKLFNKINL